MFHPNDDEYPSSNSLPQNRDPPIVVAPINDEFLSSSGEPGNGRRVPNQDVPNEQANAELRVGAQPFLTESHIPLPDRRGPDTERTRYSTDHPISSFHIGKVVQKASKEFNEDLMRGANFTAEERQQINKMTRQQKCHQILDIWQKRENTQKILFDLKLLLTKAGEPNNKYEALIRDVLRTRVTLP